ncbi:MAG: c-type cytochrome [Alphaproteobacteria bacterium]|nr:c-type cytochrome [Alphaproteobacteria bacterium]
MRLTNVLSGLTAVVFLLGAADAAIAKGDPERGKQLARDCFACHGPDGNSPSPVNPKIGGQHERYIFIALKQYLEGSRKRSLMTGSVLGKTEQELEDIAAYYAAQPGYLSRREIRARKREGVPAEQQGGPQGGGPPQGGGAQQPKFDHSDQIAKYNSMLAQAVYDAGQISAKVGESVCAAITGDVAVDSDNDGLADAYDAVPNDAGEFVTDVSGDGYFEICNIQQFEAIGALGTGEGTSTTLDRTIRMTRSYQVVRNLDASSIENFEPIGDCGPEGNCMITFDRFGFQGTVDGQGHVIRGLRVSKPGGGGVGLFGVLGQSGTVRNVVLEDAAVVGRGGVGMLVGSNFGIVYQNSAQGEAAGELAVGGLVGGSAGFVAFSESTGIVSGNQAIGGLVGDMRGAVYFSHANMEVAASRGMGGLVGLNTFGFILSSYAEGSIIGSNDVGGLVGMNTDGKVRNSYATNTVEGDGNNIGGLVGFHSLGDVRNSYATGSVTGADTVGGLVGRNNGIVKRSFAAGAVTSTGASGGISGATVEGEEIKSYWSAAAQTKDAIDLAKLSGNQTGWSPDQPPVGDLIDYFCDSNGNGFIDPEERSPDNYVWDFGSSSEPPSIRCAAKAGAQQG